MIEETKIVELVEVFEDAYDKQESASVLTKEAREELKSYAENSEMDPKAISEIYSTYAKWRRGKFHWGPEGDADDFTDILVAVMDRVTGVDKGV